MEKEEWARSGDPSARKGGRSSHGGGLKEKIEHTPFCFSSHSPPKYAILETDLFQRSVNCKNTLMN